MIMTISKESYNNLKEYWDYQRLIEYNKEILRESLKSMQVFNDFGKVSVEDMFDNIWNKVESNDFEKPPSNWIPQDEKYRFEWEDEPKTNVKSNKSKGRPVILRAKHLHNEDYNI